MKLTGQRRVAPPGLRLPPAQKIAQRSHDSPILLLVVPPRYEVRQGEDDGHRRRYDQDGSHRLPPVLPSLLQSLSANGWRQLIPRSRWHRPHEGGTNGGTSRDKRDKTRSGRGAGQRDTYVRVPCPVPPLSRVLVDRTRRDKGDRGREAGESLSPLRPGRVYPPRVPDVVNPAGTLLGRASETKGGSHHLGRGSWLDVPRLPRPAP